MAAESSATNPFKRIEDLSRLTPEDVVDRFQDNGFLWVRLASSPPIGATAETILQLVSKHDAACVKNWSVENLGTLSSEEELTPATLASKSDSSFYVSTILHKDQDEALKDFLTCNCETPLARDLHCNGGAWIFVGRHNSSAKKRKRPLAGRAEHVDDVTHSGTYHYQVSGSKRWFLKPHPDLVFPDDEAQTLLEDGRLNINVQQGDWFLLNTKLWYHCTELPDDKEWSVSIARDFYLPLPCPRSVTKGEVIFEEDEIPDELPRCSERVNCAMAEVEDDDGEPAIVMIALEDIEEGGLLFFASEESEDNECNAEEVVDPRAVVTGAFGPGDIVLEGAEIPQDLPRSLEPTCELEGDTVKALQPLQPGQVVSILPEDGEDYQEVEVDLGTGEIHRS